MTKADEFLTWLEDYGSTDESPGEVVYTWEEETGQPEAIEVARIPGDHGRWHVQMYVVYRLADNSYVRAKYLEGLTENQEDVYEDTEWDKVEAYEEVVTRYRKVSS